MNSNKGSNLLTLWYAKHLSSQDLCLIYENKWFMWHLYVKSYLFNDDFIEVEWNQMSEVWSLKCFG